MAETNAFLTGPAFPYCKGCGHHLIARNTVRAFEALGLRPLDVVTVTDIGCHGIVDRCLANHTVHGLHGRSVALGAGIAMSLPVNNKVVVFIGDGGATIGLQHLMEAARLNVNLTVVVHNNFLYGMTGGQPSGLTPCGFRTVIMPEGHTLPHYDLCQLVHSAGAAYASRVVGLGDFSETIREAMEVEGFALVEVLELCPSHGVKRNPGMRLKEWAREAGYELGSWTGDARPAYRLAAEEERPSLIEMEGVEVGFESPLEGRMAVLMGGSAGEGVQRAAELFAQAGIASGLHVTKKGAYPVTVGVGFSNAEVILSREPVYYHGVAQPDAVIITSSDGLRRNQEVIRGMDGGTVWLDESLEAPETRTEVRVRDFRGRAGPRSAALYALAHFAHETGVVPPEALVQVVRGSSLSKHVPVEVLEEAGAA
jgi:pyruvate/2-oxoacid:ferredoxin oxidoreductase beta subunit/Pyruvate/2-oxoacid:ferredoxin oxidoreductase gamma subunit